MHGARRAAPLSIPERGLALQPATEMQELTLTLTLPLTPTLTQTRHIEDIVVDGSTRGSGLGKLMISRHLALRP